MVGLQLQDKLSFMNTCINNHQRPKKKNKKKTVRVRNQRASLYDNKTIMSGHTLKALDDNNDKSLLKGLRTVSEIKPS